MNNIFFNYKLEDKIGEGGMGEVYRCRHLILKQPAAIKFLKQELTNDKYYLDKFQKEAKFMSDLNHPDFVKVKNYGIENGRVFYIMEYINAPTLYKILYNKKFLIKLSLNNKIEIIKNILNSVKYLHTLKPPIYHCDLKPTNIFVKADFKIKISDFGLHYVDKNTISFLKTNQHNSVSNTISFLSTDFEKNNKFSGTLIYLPPEFYNEKKITRQFDIYSLGIIIYEILCRRLPIGIFEPPHSIDDRIPEKFNDLIRKCLYSDLSKRYKNIKEMLFDLEFIMNKKSVRIAKTITINNTKNPSDITEPKSDNKNFNVEFKKKDTLIQDGNFKIKDKYIDYDDFDWTDKMYNVTVDNDETEIIKTLKDEFKDAGNIMKKSKVTFSEFYELKKKVNHISKIKKANNEIIDKIEVKDNEYIKIIAEFKKLKKRIMIERKKTMTLIPDIECIIGSHIGHDIEKPPYNVYVNSFYIDKFPVTINDYLKIFPEKKVEIIDKKDGSVLNLPMTNITWFEADAYARRIGKRLLSEIEWEAVAKSNNNFVFSFGNVFDKSKANIGKSNNYGYERIDKYPPNIWGVYDLTGNVWEWTYDWLMSYPNNLKNNNLTGDKYKVAKGGCWYSSENQCRNSFRFYLNPNYSLNNVGFRCAMSI